MKKNKQIRPMTDAELAAFSSQLAMLIRSGMSPYESLSLTLEEPDDDGKNSPDESALLEALHGPLSEGRTLTDAVSETKAFPDYYVKSLQLGEETGTLDNILESLASHYDREDQIAKAIRNAVTLPCVMALMILIVVFVLLTRVMPVFAQVYAQLGTALTGLPAVFYAIGQVLSRIGIILLVVAVAAAAIAWFITCTEKGKSMQGSISLKLGVGKKIRRTRDLCRFSGGLALALKAGLDTGSGIDLAAGLAVDPEFKARVESAAEKIREGEEAGTALREAGVFSGTDARLLSIASKTGETDAALESIAARTQDALDERLVSTISAVEPAMVIVLSLIVGAILLSVMLPLTGIMTGL